MDLSKDQYATGFYVEDNFSGGFRPLKRLCWHEIKTAPIGVPVLALWKDGRFAVASYTGRDDFMFECPLWLVEHEPSRYPPLCWVELPLFIKQ